MGGSGGGQSLARSVAIHSYLAGALAERGFTVEDDRSLVNVFIGGDVVGLTVLAGSDSVILDVHHKLPSTTLMALRNGVSVDDYWLDYKGSVDMKLGHPDLVERIVDTLDVVARGEFY